MDPYSVFFTILCYWGGWQLWKCIDSIGKEDDETETRD